MLRVTSTRSNITVAGFATKVPFVTGQTDMLEAARLMLTDKSTLLPVIQSEENPVLQGVVSLLDVFMNIDSSKLPDKRISEIMSKDVVIASPDDAITKVWNKMIDSDLTGLPVIKAGKPIGMITMFDILKRGWARISKEDDRRPVDSTQMRVEKLMSTPLYTVRPEDSLLTALKTMANYDVGRISVVDGEGKLVGIVDRYDLIKTYLGD